MTSPPENSQETINNILDHAVDSTEGRSQYINNFRFFLGPNEIIIDMYLMVPDGTSQNGLQASRVHRIIVPVSAGKDFANTLSQTIQHWEETFGVTLSPSPLVSSASEKSG
jgi:hypothetical protein